MKRIISFCFLLIPLITFSQSKEILKEDLVGVWLVNEIKWNGSKVDKDVSLQDEIILREDNTQTSTDKAFNYEEFGPWRLIDNKYIELTDSEKNQKKLFEIISLQNNVLKVRIKYDATIIEMTLNKK